jgi:hypothetical protein
MRLCLLALALLSTISYARVMNPSAFIGEKLFGSTSGSILFSSGTSLSQDNAKLYWNDSSGYLGVGTNNPQYTIQTTGTMAAQNYLLPVGSNYVLINPPATLAATYVLTLPSAQGAANTYLVNNGSGQTSWTYPQLAVTSYTSTTAQAMTTTAGVFTGLTATPAAGSYTASCGVNVTASSAGGNVLTISIYVNGAQVASSARAVTPLSSAALSTFQASSVFTKTFVTVNGSQSIACYGVTSAGTVTGTQKEMILERVD